MNEGQRVGRGCFMAAPHSAAQPVRAFLTQTLSPRSDFAMVLVVKRLLSLTSAINDGSPVSRDSCLLLGAGESTSLSTFPHRSGDAWSSGTILPSLRTVEQQRRAGGQGQRASVRSCCLLVRAAQC